MARKIFRFCSFVISVFLFLLFAGQVSAYNQYEVTSFESTIILQQNTDLLVEEEITAFFNVQKHGIYRIVPVTYSAKGKTINANFELLAVTDEKGNRIPVEESKYGRSIKLKIGDPGKTIAGEQIYVIEYRLSDVVQRFEGFDEVYWNVVGSEWDTIIQNTRTQFVSDYAEVKDTECFAGTAGTDDKNCKIESENGKYFVISETSLGPGKDLTVIFTLDKNSQLAFPSQAQKSAKTLKDNWGYLFSLLPLAVMIFFWYKKGRDKRFVGDAVYYEPEEKSTKDKSIFAREHIPLVYHPIDNLTPSEVGTIIDEKVDIEDVMAEIVELARLGYMDLVRIEAGGWPSRDTYAFIKKDKDKRELRDYQKLLLKEIFRSNVIHKSVSKAEKIFKNNKGELDKVRRLLVKKEYVLNTALENHFYESLPRFKEKLYKGLSERGYFDGNPDKVRTKWIGIYVGLFILTAGSVTFFLMLTGNPGPLIVLFMAFLPGIFVSYFMPRKTALGYMYARQADGLRFYLRKGEWRYEIQEKKLFLEEMLPLAISLGVVGKLTKDMGKLGVKPPSYTYGFPTSNFSGSFRGFESGVTSSLISSPGGKWSGSGSWSGGSGFSGGSVGGGFGGGGGGSW